MPSGFDNPPIAEDWGYAIRVWIGDDAMLLGVTSAFDDDPNLWRIAVSEDAGRGVFPWIRKRRMAQAAKLTESLERSLRDAEGVTAVSVDRQGE